MRNLERQVALLELLGQNQEAFLREQLTAPRALQWDDSEKSTRRLTPALALAGYRGRVRH